MASLHDDINTILVRYFTLWNDWKMDELRRMWDSDEKEPIYVAEERDPLIGWPALLDYWKVSEPRRSEHFIAFSDLHVREIAPGVAHAFYLLSWNFFVIGNRMYQKPIGGEVRATTLLRKKPDGWKFFHHIESPLASLIQLKRAHEQNVDERLFTMLEAKGLYTRSKP